MTHLVLAAVAIIVAGESAVPITPAPVGAGFEKQALIRFRQEKLRDDHHHYRL